MADFDKNLLQENIEEYVNDENKIVTCRWLSLTHSININAAKRALHLFIDNQRNKCNNDDINVTFFVAGLGKAKDGVSIHKCAVVPEDQLEVVKKSLSPVTSCHVYSVQKAKLKDYTPLYMTDYEIVKNNLEICNSLSSIKCPWVTQRSMTQAPVQAKNTANIKTEPKGPASSNNGTSNTNKEAPSKPTQKKTEPKGSIASMFAAAGSKGASGDKAAKQTQKAEPPSKPKPADKNGGMMAFVNKNADQPSKKEETTKTANTSSKNVDSKNNQKNNKPEAKSKRKSKQIAASDDEGPDKKRRRRIRTDLFDSSDEEADNAESEQEEPEENVEEEEEPPINISPETEDVAEEKDIEVDESDTREEDVKVKDEPVEDSSENTASTGKKRKRVKKQVTRHYQDEEGFMVTKKEMVWESETDEEAEEKEKEKQTEKKVTAPANKPAGKNKPLKAEPKGRGASKKANASPQKSKQTSLMSFFKKN